MSRYVLHACPLVMPGSYLLGLWLAEHLLLLAPACVLLVLTPLLDALLPRDRTTDTSRRFPIRYLPAVYVVLHAACLCFTATAMATGAFDFGMATAASLSLGAIGGVSITASHELLHGASRAGRSIGRFGMLLVAYGHFEISHLYGHHRHAGTASDHSTAWRGESLYRYLARTIPACYAFSRREALHRGWQWSFRHPLSPGRSLAVAVGLALVLTGIGGLPMLAIHICQATMAVLLLEATSYVQHYGLLRADLGNGSQRLGAEHSWDSDHAVSTALLFRLPRHADHHLHAGRGFTQLSLHEAAQPLPAGYSTMILLAMVPPLWRRIMHARLPTNAGPETTRANLTAIPVS